MPVDPEQYQASVIANMEKKTGKTLQQWVEILRSSGLIKFKEQVNWLKENHGVGHTAAQQVAWEANKPADFTPPSDDEIIAAQYAGPKAALRPIYDRALEVLKTVGDDCAIKACQTYVAVSRNRQFLVIQPSTRTRVDLGFSLPGIEAGGRLQPAKNVGSGRTSHMVAVTSPDEIDSEVISWIKMAYEAN